MGKNSSKGFVNQFKNTRRLAGRQAAAPLWGRPGAAPMRGKTQPDQKKFTNAAPRPLKKFFPIQPKKEKNTDSGNK